MKNAICLISIILIAVTSMAQTVTPQGSATQIYWYRGGVMVDSFGKVAPIRDTTAYFGRKSDFVRLAADNNRLYFYDGEKYIKLNSSGSSGIDTSYLYLVLDSFVNKSDSTILYVTPSQLRDSINAITISTPDLQEVTTGIGNNISSHGIAASGYDGINTDSQTTVIYNYGNILNAGGIGYTSPGTFRRVLEYGEESGTTILYNDKHSQTILLREETPSNPGIVASARIRGVAGINPYELVTVQQLSDSIQGIPTGAGSVTNITGTNSTGITWSISNPTTTPDLSLSLTKAAVGLSNVDNTTDLNKPISTATQTALDLKANIASPSFTGIPAAPTATVGTNTTQLATTSFVSQAVGLAVNSDTLSKFIRQGGNSYSTNLRIGTNDNGTGIDFLLFGAIRASISSNGTFNGPGLANLINGVNYGNITTGNVANPTSIDRNIADAISALRVNNAAAGSTGSIQEWMSNGSVVSKLSKAGSLNIGGLATFGSSSIAPTHSITIPSVGTGFVHYNTVDQTTNFERVRQYWIGNVWTVNTEQGGTGAARPIKMLVGVRSINLTNTASTTGHINFDFNSTSSAGSGVGVIGSFTSSSNTQNAFSIVNTINQGGTGAYRGLWISPLETATGSGIKYLIDAGTNSGATGTGTHTSKFSVDNLGNVTATTFSGDVILNNTTASQLLKVDATKKIVSATINVDYVAYVGETILSLSSTQTISVNTAFPTASTTACVVYCDASGGNITLTLPGVIDIAGKGPMYFIKTDNSANTVIVKGAGIILINNSNTQSLTSQYQKITVRGGDLGQYWLF